MARPRKTTQVEVGQDNDPVALFVDTFQAQQVRLAVDPIKVSSKSIFHEDTDFDSFFQTLLSDSFPENETQNTESEDNRSATHKQQTREHETLRKIRKLIWQKAFQDSYQNTQASRYIQKYRNRAYGLSKFYQLQSSKHQLKIKTSLPSSVSQAPLLTLCQEAFLPLLQSTSQNDPRVCLSILESISKFLSKGVATPIVACPFTDALQEQLYGLVSSSNDDTIFLKASQVLFELGISIGSAKFLLLFIAGLLKNVNKPGTLQIGSHLRKLTAYPYQINLPNAYITEFDMGIVQQAQASICTDGHYLYVLNDGIHKIGTPKGIPGLFYGVYRPAVALECICYLLSMKKLVCLQTSTGNQNKAANLNVVNPATMEEEGTFTVVYDKDVALVESTWLAADYEFLYLARKTLGELHILKFQLHHSAESGFSFTPLENFSCIHYWGSNKVQFWTDGRQFLSMSVPPNGQYNLYKKDTGFVESHPWNFNYPNTICFDVINNKTFMLPRYSDGRAQILKNSGTASLLADDSNYFGRFLKSQDNTTLTSYMSQLPDELDVHSSLTAMLGYLDLIATPFCSHLDMNENSMSEKYCLELCKTTFSEFPDLLSNGIQVLKSSESRMTDMEKLPQEVLWLLVVLKLLRIHFVRTVDLNVDSVALQLLQDPSTPLLAGKIELHLIELLQLSEKSTVPYFTLICHESARAYSSGLCFFYPSSADRTKFINELLFNNDNSPSKRVLLEEICDDISLPSLEDVIEKPKTAEPKTVPNPSNSDDDIISEEDTQSIPDSMQTEQQNNSAVQPESDPMTTNIPAEGTSTEKPPKLESVLEELDAMTKSLTNLVVAHNQSCQLAVLQGKGQETPFPSKPLKLVVAIQKELFSHLSTNTLDNSPSMQLVSKAVISHVEFLFRGACQYLQSLSESIQLIKEITEDVEKNILLCMENSVIMKVIPNLMLNINALRNQAKNKSSQNVAISMIQKIAQPLREYCFSLQSILSNLPCMKAFEESVQQFYQKRYIQVIETPHPTLNNFRSEGYVKFPKEVSVVTGHFDSRGEQLKIKLNIGNQTVKDVPALPILITGNEFSYRLYPKLQTCWGVKLTLIGHTATGDVTMMDHMRSQNVTQFLYDVHKFGWNLLSHLVSRMIVGIPLSTQEEEHGHWLQSQLFSAGPDNKKPFSLQESRSGATFEDTELHAFVEQLLIADKPSPATAVFQGMKGNRDSFGGQNMDMMERYVVAVLLKHNNLIPDAIRYSECITTQPKLPPRLDFVWKTVLKMRNFITQKHQEHKKNNADASDEDVYKQLCDQVIQPCKVLLQYAPASQLQLKNYLETVPHHPLQQQANHSAEPRKSLKRSNTVLIEENEPKNKTPRTLGRTASTMSSESISLNHSFNDNNTPNKLSRGSTFYRTIRRSSSSLNFENTISNQESVKKTMLRAGSTMIAIQRWKLRALASPHVSEECQKTSRIILKIIQSGVDLEPLLATQKERAMQRTEGLRLANEMLLKSEFPSTNEDLLSMLIIELYEANFAGYRDNIQASDISASEVRNSFWTFLHTILQLLPQQSVRRKPLLLSFLGMKLSPLDLPRIAQLKILEYLFAELKKNLETDNQSSEIYHETHAIQFSLLGIIETSLFGHEAKNIIEDTIQYVDEESYTTLKELLSGMQSNSINMLHQLVGIFIKKGYELSQARKLHPDVDTTAFQNFEMTLFLYLGTIARLANNSVASKLFGAQFTGDLIPLCAIGSLRCSRSVFRFLRKMLPKFAPAAMDNCLQTSTVTAGLNVSSEAPLASLFNIGPNHLIHNITEVLLLEIGKMHRSDSAEICPPITTGRSFLAIQSELIMLVRILLEAPAWKDDLTSKFVSSLNVLGTILEAGMKIDWTDTLASCFGALAVFGGHIDVLRVGGRCSIKVENGSGVSDRGVIVQWDMSPGANYMFPHPSDIITPSEMLETVNAMVLLDSSSDSTTSSVECYRLQPIPEIYPNRSLLCSDSEIIPRLLHLASSLHMEVTPKDSHPIRVQAVAMITLILAYLFQEAAILNEYSSLLKKTGFIGSLMKMALEPIPSEANECAGLSIDQLEDMYSMIAMRIRDVSDTYQVSVPYFLSPPTLDTAAEQQLPTSITNLHPAQEEFEDPNFAYYNCSFEFLNSNSSFQARIGSLVKLNPLGESDETALLKNKPGILCGTSPTQAAVCFFDEESSFLKNLWLERTNVMLWKGSITIPPESNFIPFNPKRLLVEATRHWKSLAISYAREILICTFCEPQTDLIAPSSPSDRSDIIRLTKLITGKFVQIFDLYIPLDDTTDPISDNSISWHPNTPFSHDKLPSFQENIMKMIHSCGMADMVLQECMDFFKSSPWVVTVESPKSSSRQNATCDLYFPHASVLYFFREENKSLRLTVVDSRTNREVTTQIPTIFFQDQVMFKTAPQKILILPIGSRMVDSGALTKSNSHFIWWMLSVTPTSYPQIFSKMLNAAFYNGLIDFCKRKDIAYVLNIYGMKWLTCAIYHLLKEVESMKGSMDETNLHWFLEQDFSKLGYFLGLVNKQGKVKKEDNFKIQFKVAVELALVIIKTKNLLKSYGKLQDKPLMDVSMIENKPEEKKQEEEMLVESNDNMEEDTEPSQKEDDEKPEEEEENEEKEDESQRNESQNEDDDEEDAEKGSDDDEQVDEPWPSMRLDTNPITSNEIPTWIKTLLSLSSVLASFAASKERNISIEWMQQAILELVKPPEVFESPHPYGKSAQKEFSYNFPEAKMLIFRFDTNTHIQPSDELVLETVEKHKDIISLGKDTSTSKLDQSIAECDGNSFRGYFRVNRISYDSIILTFPAVSHDEECQDCSETEGVLWWCLCCLQWICNTHLMEHSNQEPEHYFAKFRRPLQSNNDTDNLQDISLPVIIWQDGADHTGTQCVNCGQSPIRGIRYKCGNCGVNLCEACEDLDSHDMTHVLIRLHRPVPASMEEKITYPSKQQVDWGYKFSVQPIYDEQALKALSETDKERMAGLVHLLEGWSLEDDINLVTFINDLGKDPLLMVHTDLTPELIAANTKASNASLQSIPIEKIQARFTVLKYLNHQLDQLLPVFDTQAPTTEPWTLSHLLQGIKPLIFLEVKLAFLDKKTQSSTDHETRNLTLDRGVSGKTKAEPLFVQAFKQLQSDDYDYLKVPVDEQAFEVTFVGEGSQDAGGPYAEAITTMIGEIQSSDIPLFIPCPNKTGEVGLNRDKFVPNPSMTSPTHMKMFKLVGVLMGISIRTNSCIPLNLPSLFWKKLIGEKVDRSDLLAIDQICIQSLDTLNNIEQEGITRETFSDAIAFTFTTTSSDGREVELKEGGKNIEVTWDNRHEYAKTVEEYRLGEFDRQIQSIESGLRTVIPSEYFSLCTWQEMELRICGKPEINLELLKQQTDYCGLNATDPLVQNFWKALESFSHEQRSMFLRFTSGRTRLPSLLSDFSKKFQLMKFGLVVPNPDNYLPTAHTCFFQLELPNYSNYEVLRAKLLFAVTECKAIDTDFNVRDEDIEEY